MSYLVLARKWRPQTFEAVVGQGHITQTLRRAIEQNRVAHAFLFAGPRGVGKTSTARILSKALNCEHGPTPNPCQKCTACREITEGHFIDVIEIDGASNRGIAEIRALRQGIHYAPNRGRYKIYIIDEVHMLTTEAFNALLKTLEEPPPHVKFIFATTEPRKIPVTILSRCQRYDFKRVSLTEIVHRLKTIAQAEGLAFDDQALHLIAQQAHGGMRDALSAMDQVIAFGGERLNETLVADLLGIPSQSYLVQMGEAIVQRRPAQALQILHEIDEKGLDLVQFAQTLLQHLRDLAVLSSLGEPTPWVDLSTAVQVRVLKIADQTSLAHLQDLFALFYQRLEAIYRSPSPKLLLEMAILQMIALEPLVPLEPLVGKLQAMERALSGTKDLSQKVYERYQAHFKSFSKLPQTSPFSSTTSSSSAPSAPPSPPLSSSPSAPASGAASILSKASQGQVPMPQEDNPLANPPQKWIQWIEAIRSQSPKLAAVMEEAFLIRWDSQKLEFWIADDYLVSINEEVDWPILQTQARVIQGHPIEVHRLKTFEQSLFKTYRSYLEEQKAIEKKSRIKAIYDDPVFQKALRIFDLKASDAQIHIHLDKALS